MVVVNCQISLASSAITDPAGSTLRGKQFVVIVEGDPVSLFKVGIMPLVFLSILPADVTAW